MYSCNEMVTVVLETVEDVWYGLWGCGGSITGGGTPLGNMSARRGGSSRWAEPGEGKHVANSDTK